MQGKDPASRSNRGAIGEQLRVVYVHLLQAKQTLRMERVLVDSEVMTNAAVQGKDGGLQPANRCVTCGTGSADR